MTFRLAASLGAIGIYLTATVTVGGQQAGACEWTPPSGRVIDVRNVRDLEQAAARVRPGETILLADGIYQLERAIHIAQPDVTLRSRSRDAAKVTLRGRGMTNDPVGVALSIGAPGVTIAEVTIRDVGNHAVQVRGESGASRFGLYRARLLDTGQQLLKGSVDDKPPYADNGVVACNEFSYTTHAPSDYTNGVDLIAVKGWHIRDNRFLRIRGPESGRWASGPAVLVWGASEDTIVERNIVIDSFRGIAFGLVPGTNDRARNGDRVHDHIGGIIRNNVVVNLNPWADEAIEATAARDVRIEHNTVLLESANIGWSIGVRYPSATAVVRNNLANKPVRLRNGGTAVEEGNVMSAGRDWFIDPAGANLRLARPDIAAVDAGVVISDAASDFDLRPRTSGRAPDAGAHELPSQ